MKRANIFTQYGNYNYGNKLQNFAVQELLASIGVEAYTLRYTKRLNLKQKVKDIVKLVIPKYRTNQLRSQQREKKFRIFDEKIKKIGIREFFHKKADFIIEGSDQVWNPYYTRNDVIENLNSIPGNKIIALSASIAIDNIPSEYYNLYKDHFNHVKYISVREEAGKETIMKMTDRGDVQVLLDPTMILDRSVWDNMMDKPKILGEQKYILCYFLGKISEERKRIIKKLSDECKAKVIYLMDKNDPYYTSGPTEFIYLESHAELVCTDSFHSVVFAILYNRPFFVFNREDKDERMNSRLNTLLDRFGLKNHWYNKRCLAKDAQIKDYAKVDNVLKIERAKFRDFLEKAISK